MAVEGLPDIAVYSPAIQNPDLPISEVFHYWVGSGFETRTC